MTPHEYCHPARVQEIRPQDRFVPTEHESAPATPLATDDGRPLTTTPAPPVAAPPAR